MSSNGCWFCVFFYHVLNLHYNSGRNISWLVRANLWARGRPPSGIVALVYVPPWNWKLCLVVVILLTVYKYLWWLILKIQSTKNKTFLTYTSKQTNSTITSHIFLFLLIYFVILLTSYTMLASEETWQVQGKISYGDLGLGGCNVRTRNRK